MPLPLKVLLSLCLLCASLWVQGGSSLGLAASTFGVQSAPLCGVGTELGSQEGSALAALNTANPYQPSVTHDDNNTEFFWAPETLAVGVSPGSALPPQPQLAHTSIWLRVPLRPPTHTAV